MAVAASDLWVGKVWAGEIRLPTSTQSLDIWGDDRGSCAGNDQVADTPNQGDATFGQPSFPQISCNNGPDGNMFMNYMDYTDDAAMVMFTRGQSRRIDACLEGPRASFFAATSLSTAPKPATSAAPGQAQGDGPGQDLQQQLERLREDYQRVASTLNRIRTVLDSVPTTPAGG